MHWTWEYVVQSGLWLALWLAAGAMVAKYTIARRDR
jgi:hypothetical protein